MEFRQGGLVHPQAVEVVGHAPVGKATVGAEGVPPHQHGGFYGVPLDEVVALKTKLSMHPCHDDGGCLLTPVKGHKKSMSPAYR